MVEYLCDTCNKRARESKGHYVRCRYFGDVRKRIRCEKCFDETVIIKKQCKVNLLDWTGVN